MNEFQVWLYDNSGRRERRIFGKVLSFIVFVSSLVFFLLGVFINENFINNEAAYIFLLVNAVLVCFIIAIFLSLNLSFIKWKGKLLLRKNEVTFIDNSGNEYPINHAEIHLNICKRDFETMNNNKQEVKGFLPYDNYLVTNEHPLNTTNVAVFIDTSEDLKMLQHFNNNIEFKPRFISRPFFEMSFLEIFGGWHF